MFLLNKLWGYLAAAGGLVLVVLGALGFAKRSGEKQEQAKETELSLKQSKEANVISQNVRNLSDDDLAKRLRVDQRD